MKLTQLPSIILNLCHVFSLVLYKSIHKQELPDCSLSLILSYVILRRQQRQKVCNKRRKVHSIV